MGTSSNLRSVPTKARRASADRRACEAAVITGLYVATGRAILHAKPQDYALALKNIVRVARDQADELLKTPGTRK